MAADAGEDDEDANDNRCSLLSSVFASAADRLTMRLWWLSRDAFNALVMGQSLFPQRLTRCLARPHILHRTSTNF